MQFLSTLSEILFANVDTSSQVLNTIFTNLAANSAVQNALRREIQENEGAGDAYLHNSASLLHRVLLESMRVCSALCKWSINLVLYLAVDRFLPTIRSSNEA